jgi:subtilisin family serine protease
MTWTARVSLVACILVSVILMEGGAFSASADNHRKIVTFYGPPPQDVFNMLPGAGITVPYDLWLINALAVQLPTPPPGGPDPALVLLQGLPDLQGIYDDVLTFVDPICPTTALPPGPESYRWGPQQIEVPAVDQQRHQIQGSTAVTVAVLDTGIASHPELSERTAPGYNAITGTGQPTDFHGHGTHMAGIILANQNGVGVVGVAGVEPKIKVAAVKVLDDTGAGYLSVVINGLQWALDNDIWLVNMSWGFSFSNPSDGNPLRQVIQSLSNADIVMVASAGNRCTAGGASDESGGDDCGPAATCAAPLTPSRLRPPTQGSSPWWLPTPLERSLPIACRDRSWLWWPPEERRLAEHRIMVRFSPPTQAASMDGDTGPVTRPPMSPEPSH